MSRKVLMKRFFEDEDADADTDDVKCPPQQDDDDGNDDGDEEEGEKKIRGVDPPRHVPWTSPNELLARREAKNTAQRTSGGQHVVSPSRRPDVSAGAATVESQGCRRPSVLEERRPGAVVIPDIDRHTTQGTSGGPHLVTTARSQVTGPGTAELGSQGHHPFVFEERRPGAVIIPGIDINEGYEDLATVATRDDLTVNVIARVVDTEEENRRLREQERMHHEQEWIHHEQQWMRHERDRAVHERDQLRRMVDNAVIVTPVVATNGDVDVAEGISNRRRQWQLAGALLLVILIVLAIVMSITLSKEPEPTLSLQDLVNLLSSVSSDGGEALSTPLTPQSKALEWLAGNSNLGSYTSETIIQHYALATLYYSMNGDHWSSRYFWVSNEHMCGTPWYGIVCTDTGAVTDLDLPENSLSGMIPPEIGLLSDSLEILWLYDNMLNGTIPTEIGKLTQLSTLHLGLNVLKGTIPIEIGQLKQLTWLDLSINAFTGMIPSEIWLLAGLEELWLDGNVLKGTIPTEIGQLKQLKKLWLRWNALDGTIPTEIRQLTQLISLDLAGNSLSGTIPLEIGLLSRLENLFFAFNVLDGTIPTEIQQLKQLTSLGFDHNNLTGTIPSEINSLTNLVELYLYNNMFMGNYTCPNFIDYCIISCDPRDDNFQYTDACRSLG